ncbi:MAG: hypothetical protein NC416_18330 [Eubacterium sp.]|nr:hypothetical protein [Eubacterium sp.]
MDHIVKAAEHFWIIEENGVRSSLLEGQERAMLADTGFGTLPLGCLRCGGIFILIHAFCRINGKLPIPKIPLISC